MKTVSTGKVSSCPQIPDRLNKSSEVLFVSMLQMIKRFYNLVQLALDPLVLAVSKLFQLLQHLVTAGFWRTTTCTLFKLFYKYFSDAEGSTHSLLSHFTACNRIVNVRQQAKETFQGKQKRRKTNKGIKRRSKAAVNCTEMEKAS